ncbi:MAG: GDSL-type esterase/lipase family protein [Oscillospiraceae bacterium]|nr:GDSL-type esterase/lipase family protein [Oscillospiraceae bacterium]
MTEYRGNWRTIWGNATSIADTKPEGYAKDITLRYPIKVFTDCKAFRIRFDNFCGTEPITLSDVSIAPCNEKGNITESGIVPLTFHDGDSAVIIPPGETAESDCAVMPISAGEYLAVTIYLKDYTQMRSGIVITGPLSNGFFALGNQTRRGVLDLNTSRPIKTFYWLTDVIADTAESVRSIICYGDSISAQGWPEYLAQRAFDISGGKTCIVKRAACGTRILRQYEDITYQSYGLKGSIRFPRECQALGADTVIIQHGINDIIHPVGVEQNPFRPWSDLPTVEELTEGLRSYIRYAHTQGMKVYLGTLLPIYGWRTYADFREELRQELNEWIRTNQEAEGCIDFDAALRDEAQPVRFRDGYDSGDHLHPSTAAYQEMAAIVPAALLK